MAYIATPLPHYLYIPREQWKTMPPGLQADLFFEAEETDDGDELFVKFGFAADQAVIIGLLAQRLTNSRIRHAYVAIPEGVTT